MLAHAYRVLVRELSETFWFSKTFAFSVGFRPSSIDSRLTLHVCATLKRRQLRRQLRVSQAAEQLPPVRTIKSPVKATRYVLRAHS